MFTFVKSLRINSLECEVTIRVHQDKSNNNINTYYLNLYNALNNRVMFQKSYSMVNDKYYFVEVLDMFVNEFKRVYFGKSADELNEYICE